MFLNVSSTTKHYFPDQARNIVFPIKKHILRPKCNNTLRFVRANVSQQMFPSLPMIGNMTKHQQETMFLEQCFLVSSHVLSELRTIHAGVFCRVDVAWTPRNRKTKRGETLHAVVFWRVDVARGRGETLHAVVFWRVDVAQGTGK